MNIKSIKQKAKENIKGKYGLAIVNMLLLSLIEFASIAFGFGIGGILAGGAINCSYCSFYLDIAKDNVPTQDATYCGFNKFIKAMYVNIIFALIYGIYFAWFILYRINIDNVSFYIVMLGITVIMLVVYLLLQYSMTFYIMIENDELSWKECLKESKKITKGNMRKNFLFELSFIGWFLLSVLTLGALFFYVLPYYKTAHANLYLTLKENQKMSKEGLL